MTPTRSTDNDFEISEDVQGALFPYNRLCNERHSGTCFHAFQLHADRTMMLQALASRPIIYSTIVIREWCHNTILKQLTTDVEEAILATFRPNLSFSSQTCDILKHTGWVAYRNVVRTNASKSFNTLSRWASGQVQIAQLQKCFVKIVCCVHR